MIGLWGRWAAAGVLFGSLTGGWAAGQDSAGLAEVRAAGARFVEAFQAGKAAEVAATFTAKGELVDEEGSVYQGPAEIAVVLGKFFEKFPAARLTVTPEVLRLAGDTIALEDGVRTITAGNAAKARMRYSAVWSKGVAGWKLASFREFADDPLPTPHERLQPLSWLVGEWVNEGAESAVKIKYEWAEAGNFLLGHYEFASGGKAGLKSTHRIGWDPLAGKVRSWLFDSDGGYSEGLWTTVDGGWLIKSTAVNPDATTGSATLTFLPTGKDGFTIKGAERIVGDAREPDFELKIVRRPPAAAR